MLLYYYLEGLLKEIGYMRDIYAHRNTPSRLAFQPHDALLIVPRSADDMVHACASEIAAGLHALSSNITVSTQERPAANMSRFDLIFTFTPQDTHEVTTTYKDCVPSSRHFFISPLSAYHCHRMWAGQAHGVCDNHNHIKYLLEAATTLFPDLSHIRVPFNRTFVASLPDPLIPFTTEWTDLIEQQNLTSSRIGHDATDEIELLFTGMQPGQALLMLGMNGMNSLIKHVSKTCLDKGIILLSDASYSTAYGATLSTGPTPQELSRLCLSQVQRTCIYENTGTRFTASGGSLRVYANQKNVEDLRLHKEKLTVGYVYNLQNACTLTPTIYSHITKEHQVT